MALELRPVGARIALSASDRRALRGLRQRNGGPLSVERAERFTRLGLVRPLPHVSECYPGRSPAYALTTAGVASLESAGGLP